MLADQMSEHLGVRAGMKLMSGLDEALLELIVVLDHAVVDDGNLARLIEMRMGVFIAGADRAWPSGYARCRRLR